MPSCYTLSINLFTGGLKMRAVVQKVSHASVAVEGKTLGSIGQGLLVFLGIAPDDTDEDLKYLVKKVTQLRIFEDAQDKMNLALADVGGALLVISQFTLFADTRKGNRPSFVKAGPPDFSKAMYLKFIKACRDLGYTCEEGEFGAHMEISLLNDGPVTIIIDTRER